MPGTAKSPALGKRWRQPGVVPAAAQRDGAIELETIRLDVGPAVLGRATALLCPAERERASRFVFERDRRRFIVARARLRELLGDRLGVCPAAIEFTYGPCGKPALAPRFAHSGLRFNVSHSGDVAVHALSWEREIGVDVEIVRALSDADEIAARFFSPAEHEAYRDLDPLERPVAFFNCWTRKEAFIKALGYGLGYPLSAFDVTLVPGEPARILRVGNGAGDDCGWTLQSFDPGAGLAGAVVFRNHGSSW